MIHSLAGGVIKDLSILDYAKVIILEGENAGQTRWYAYDIIDLKINDIVLVPSGFVKTEKAKVLKIERNLSAQTAPIPSKKVQYIIEKIKE